MNPKYLGKALALPKETHSSLEEIREWLNTELGFRPSLSETVAYLCRFHREKMLHGEQMDAEKDTPELVVKEK